MSEDQPWQYYAALAVSGISTLAWFGVIGGLLLIGYFAVTGQPISDAALGTGIAFVIGIGGAQLERRLYRLDQSE